MRASGEQKMSDRLDTCAGSTLELLSTSNNPAYGIVQPPFGRDQPAIDSQADSRANIARARNHDGDGGGSGVTPGIHEQQGVINTTAVGSNEDYTYIVDMPQESADTADIVVPQTVSVQTYYNDTLHV